MGAARWCQDFESCSRCGCFSEFLLSSDCKGRLPGSSWLQEWAKEAGTRYTWSPSHLNSSITFTCYTFSKTVLFKNFMCLLADQQTLWQIICLVLRMEDALLHKLKRGQVPRSLACYSWPLDFTTAISYVTFGCAYCLGVGRLYSISTPAEAVEKFPNTNMQRIHALLYRS
jgi:hypothetical protein